MPCKHCEETLRHQFEATEKGVSVLRNEFNCDLEDMGVDDNKGEQSINRLWSESADDGGIQ
jgi:hypothetical protein